MTIERRFKFLTNKLKKYKRRPLRFNFDDTILGEVIDIKLINNTIHIKGITQFDNHIQTLYVITKTTNDDCIYLPDEHMIICFR